jgi:hypothetical protein
MSLTFEHLRILADDNNPGGQQRAWRTHGLVSCAAQRRGRVLEFPGAGLEPWISAASALEVRQNLIREKLRLSKNIVIGHAAEGEREA